MKEKAVFFDRDGVINVDKGYTYRLEDLAFVAGAPEAIRYFNQAGFLVIVVTNQSGVARGFYTEADVEIFHRGMNEALMGKGAHIDHFYSCPHHEQGSVSMYSFACDCRKPKPGMIYQAATDWNIDLTRSFMVGDKESDRQAAEAAGLKGYLFLGGNLYEFLRQASLITAKEGDYESGRNF